MYKTTFAVLFGVLALVLVCATPAAACPDIINCVKPTSVSRNNVAATIEWPTCYKALAGCRPRHCDNARDLSDDYWTNQCKERFPSKCVNSKGENKCTATFPTF